LLGQDLSLTPLGHAAQADAGRRIITVAIADKVGPGAEDVWRQWAQAPGFGVYARSWRAAHGSKVAAHPSDEAWLQAEALSASLNAIPGEGSSGHPDALRLTAEITELTGVRSRSALRTPRRLQKKRLSQNESQPGTPRNQ
jgi:hypothetical protein